MHPSHTKRNILFNLARKICTIVEERNTGDQRLTELKNTLVKQGYPVQLVEFGAQKTTEIQVVDLRQPKDKDKEDMPILSFVSTFNPRNPDMFKVIKDTLPLLNASPRMKKSLKNIKLVNSKRQPSNLKKLLTRARFELSTTQKQEHQGVKKVHRCTAKTCLTCTVLEETDKVTFNSCQETFMIKNEMDCSCKDIIYLLTCGGCKKTVHRRNQHLENKSQNKQAANFGSSSPAPLREPPHCPLRNKKKKTIHDRTILLTESR